MKILLIEDHKMMASSLKEILEKDKFFEIDLLEDLKNLEDINFLSSYDILLVDINLRGFEESLNGLDLAEKILNKDKNIKIVILSGYDLFFYGERAKSLGAYAFISKEEDMESLRNKLREVYLNDKKFFKEKEIIENLTEKEVEIMKLYCSGLKRSQVAKELFISERSLAVMLNRIYQKLYINNYQELMKKAMDLGIIDSF
ncbi:MAG: response regulator transcription factor [Peptoniphilus grossensis]|uniref:DNA-binding response regulator n=1 Tax=Peptoniphilus grossensis TaxID=1465756 RepID=UPI00290BBCED|nr:response regulator transcription factor [Peptoniphilus grossensis]MDU7151405.1 response regulator transcription factor [Peptoniphilus grossensis]